MVDSPRLSCCEENLKAKNILLIKRINIDLSKQSIARAIYVLIVCFVLSIIAVGIHKKAYQAVAPPIYDPISYYSKSKIVWDAISQHQWKSAFEQLPQRPPGTVLILYPFGFVPSIQSFLFRSTFAPIAIWALALLVIIMPKIRNSKEMLVGAALTVGLLSLPIFYHFEFPTNPERAFGISIQWGLVDVLEGSIGALALGFLYSGVRKSIKSMVLIAWLLGASTFFIKPSGILVLGALFPIYLTEVFILWKQEAQNKKKIFIWHLSLFAVGIGITVSSIMLAVSSGYLSKEVIESAKIGQKVLIQISNQSLWIQMDVLWMPVIGYWWIPAIVIPLLISIVSLIYSISRLQFSVLGLKFATSLLIFSAALFWWVTMAGQEHRYLFPIIMLIMSWLIIPIIFDWMISLGNKVRYIGIVYCLVPFIVIIALLNVQQGKISFKIEKFFGYNLDVAQYLDEVKMGHFILQEARRIQRPANIYSIGKYRVGVVEMIDWVNSIEHEVEAHHFTIYRVNDWIHPGIKMKQLLSCDYFIIEKSQLEGMPSFQIDAMRWQDEESTLTRFINVSADNPNSGIRLLQRGPVLLYKVENREKFVTSCNKWVASHKWSDDFWIRNSYARGDFEIPGLKVIDSKVADDLLSKTPSLLSPVDFGHKITVRAVLRNSKETTIKNGDDLLTFLLRADQDIPPKYAIFIHLMDNDKKVIFQHDFEINPDGGAIPAGTIWKSLVTISESELSKTYSIGFGAYIPNKDGSFLRSDCRSSDWNGNRVLIKLKP
ncbi:MAG: hypothetical protein NTW91_10680 [Verrucomicrobia bacterium]|nr:hypothetical protein [Verrucomicrobiota bacterium]